MEQIKQTAVEWLVEELNQKIDFIPMDKWDMIRNIVQQAKEMEKEQIINSFDEGKSDGYKTAREWDEMIIWLSAEQYYNETYGGNK
jgi:hypothetical protein